MTRPTLILALCTATTLAACGQKPAKPADTTAPAEVPAAATSTAPAAAPVSGHGTGIVQAIDAAAGTITLDHGPIPEAKWPAMIMDFTATPALLAKVAVGDEVSFDMKMADSSAELTSIAKK